MSRVQGSSWTPLIPVGEKGYLCYYWSTTRDELPIRRVENAPNGRKREPNYETRTYGDCACCEAKARQGIVSGRRRYVFFRTRDYTGARNADWHAESSYITGFYEITEYRDSGRNCFKHSGPCWSLRASRVKFLATEHARQLDASFYEKLFGEPPRENSLRSPRKLDENAILLLLDHFRDKEDLTDEYARRTLKLQASP